MLLLRTVVLSFCLSFIASAAPKDCAAIATIPLQNAEVHSELVTTSTFTPPGQKALPKLPAFCRVTISLTPSADSKINVELWLPIENWNGRLQGVGNGGYAGSISYESLAVGLRANYASVATDTGHQGSAVDATWALNHPEKIVDFGYRAIHLMTADAKDLVKAFYGKPLTHAYFNSCSNGGREGLMEAQRFPGDYDGILAGAPANYWTHLVSNSAANAQAFVLTPSSSIPSTKLPAIQAAALKACDLNDGAKDGIIENPATCHFDTSVLLCKGPNLETCLLPDEVTVLNELYAGGHFADGKLFFPGFMPGGEAARGNWDVWITGQEPGRSAMFAYGSQFFRNMVYNNPDWDYRKFQADRDVKAADEKMAATLNATNADLRPFLAHGGKLILYHGWDDAAISPLNTINYFEAVRKKSGDAAVQKSVRLFMVPGMQHCSNGNGAYNFGQSGAGTGDSEHDADAALVRWVETGLAPDRIIASKPGTDTTHPLCAYPKTAHYKGSGDVGSALNYTCER